MVLGLGPCCLSDVFYHFYQEENLPESSQKSDLCFGLAISATPASLNAPVAFMASLRCGPTADQMYLLGRSYIQDLDSTFVFRQTLMKILLITQGELGIIE